MQQTLLPIISLVKALEAMKPAIWPTQI